MYHAQTRVGMMGETLAVIAEINHLKQLFIRTLNSELGSRNSEHGTQNSFFISGESPVYGLAQQGVTRDSPHALRVIAPTYALYA